MKAKTFTFSILIVVLGLIFSTASLELLFRFVDRDKPQLQPWERKSKYTSINFTSGEAGAGKRTRSFPAAVPARLDYSRHDPAGLASRAFVYNENFHGRSVVTRKENGSIVYDIPIDTDDFGRRITYSTATSKKDFSIAAFGCSYTFGDGVKFDETWPSQLAKMVPRYSVFNYGISGSAPSIALSILRHRNLNKEMIAPPKFGIFVFFDDHVRRSNPSIYFYQTQGKAPFFDWDKDGVLHEFENYEDARPLEAHFYNLLSRSRLFSHFHLDWPTQMAESQYVRTAKLLAEMSRAWKMKTGSDDFYVVIFPGTVISGVMVRLLKSMNVKYLDYSSFSRTDMAENPFVDRDDIHPSGDAYRFLAGLIAKDLGLTGNSR